MEPENKDLRFCQPFTNWINGLDPKSRGIVYSRLDRIEDGLFGDTRSVGGGVTELKISYGPGLRAYFGQKGNVVYLINGGSKRTQDKDISYAKNFWEKCS